MRSGVVFSVVFVVGWVALCWLGGGLARAEGGRSFTVQTVYHGAWPDSQARGRATRRTALKSRLGEGVLQAPPHGVIGLDMRVQPRANPLVQGVFPRTPAALAGIAPGDVLLTVDGAPVWGKSAPAVDAMISDVPGDTVTLTFNRQGRARTVRLRVIALERLRLPDRAGFYPLYPQAFGGSGFGQSP